MKKFLKVTWIFLGLNILTIISSFFLWNFVIGLLVGKTPYINGLVFYWIGLFMVVLNILLVNLYIKKFTTKKVILISSLILTILFAIFVSIKGESYDWTRSESRYEKKINLGGGYWSEEIILHHKWTPIFKKIKLNWHSWISEPGNIEFVRFKGDYVYWLDYDKFWNYTYHKTDIETWRTSSSKREFSY